MSGARPTTTLPPIEPVGLQRTPLPEAKELPQDSAWSIWDDAVKRLDEA